MSVLPSRVKTCRYALRNIPEERTSCLHRGGSLKSRILNVFEKGVLRITSRRTEGCKTQHYDLFSLSNVLGYQSNEDGAGAWGVGRGAGSGGRGACGVLHTQYEKRGQNFGEKN